MKNVTRVRIRATPEEIWPWVAHPEGMMRWNDKLVSHQAPELDRLTSGSRFRVTYRMKRAVETWAEITTWHPYRQVEVRYRDDAARSPMAARPTGPGRPARRSADRGGTSGLGREGWALESVRLEVADGGTEVVRVLEMHLPRIPWPFRVLIGLLLRFGTPVDGTNLDRLKTVVESGEEPGWVR